MTVNATAPGDIIIIIMDVMSPYTGLQVQDIQSFTFMNKN